MARVKSHFTASVLCYKNDEHKGNLRASQKRRAEEQLKLKLKHIHNNEWGCLDVVGGIRSGKNKKINKKTEQHEWLNDVKEDKKIIISWRVNATTYVQSEQNAQRNNEKQNLKGKINKIITFSIIACTIRIWIWGVYA